MKKFEIDGRIIGPGHPVYMVAELSGNHNQSYDRAVQLIEAAKEAGADAVKLQTYTADTITIDSNSDLFKLKGTLWSGKTLYEVYQEAYTPWEWQPDLKATANRLGMACFSTPFDDTSIAFLEKMNVPAYKVASSEITDIPLLECIAETGKPVIISTGMASLGEIDEAVAVFENAGVSEIILLKCTSAYPANPADMNLLTIPHMENTFDVPCGLSDHSLGVEAALASVALGACCIEKHMTLRRSDGGPDAAFSMEPAEFKQMVDFIRVAEKAMGKVSYGPTSSEQIAKGCRRSLFVVNDIREGEKITLENVRSIRPGDGLEPKFLPQVLGKVARRDLKRGTPFSWGCVE